MTYKGSEINKQTLDPTLQQEITNATTKANSSWQKGTYNDTNVINLGSKLATRTFTINVEDWKNTGNIEQLGLVIPFRGSFSGVVKITYSTMWGSSSSWGATEVVYNLGVFGPPTSADKLNEFTITTASTEMLRNYQILRPYVNTATGDVAILLFKAPNANNPMQITVTMDGTYNSPTYNSNIYSVLKDSFVDISDIGHSNGYPWTPQTTSFLTANTYNSSNTITNIGSNRATRVFPQVNWVSQGIELWETSFYLPSSLWGLLELDIAGYSAASGGGKFVVELGIHVPDGSEPSQAFRNYTKIISASPGFTENYYVEVEHRPSVKGLFIKVYKRVYNDPVTVVATLTTTQGNHSAFEFLKGFHNGSLFNNIAEVPAGRQRDFDARITENFTLFSSFKQKIASATTDKGVPTNADATSDQMAANIRAIPTGGNSYSISAQAAYQKQFMSANGGSYLNFSYLVASMSFRPKMIYVQAISGATTYTTTCIDMYDGYDTFTYKVASYFGGQGNAIISHVRPDFTQSGNNYTFNIPVPVGNIAYNVIAT